MSLERKDVRTKLDDDYHKALTALAVADGMEISEWVERLIVREIDRIAHESRVRAEATAHLGRSGNIRDGQGIDANGRR